MEKVHFNDLTDPSFKEAFVQYFEEFGYKITIDSHIFEDMNTENGNHLLGYRDNNELIAFVMYREDTLTNWFFKEHVLFIRELWAHKAYRKTGLAKSLLLELESIASLNSIHKLILTTDASDTFYQKLGYFNDKSYTANNQDRVYTKVI